MTFYTHENVPYSELREWLILFIIAMGEIWYVANFYQDLRTWVDGFD